MAKKHKPEEIVAKLRQVDVLTSQGTPPIIHVSKNSSPPFKVDAMIETAVHMVEAACAASAMAWVVALLTWRRVLALRALALLAASVALLILLGAPPRVIGSGIVCVFVVVFLELAQHRLPGRTDRPRP